MSNELTVARRHLHMVIGKDVKWRLPLSDATLNAWQRGTLVNIHKEGVELKHYKYLVPWYKFTDPITVYDAKIFMICQNHTREAYHSAGWTDEQIIDNKVGVYV